MRETKIKSPKDTNEVFSSEKESRKEFVEKYKKQNPKKYEQKKVVLEKWINEVE